MAWTSTKKIYETRKCPLKLTLILLVQLENLHFDLQINLAVSSICEKHFEVEVLQNVSKITSASRRCFMTTKP